MKQLVTTRLAACLYQVPNDSTVQALLYGAMSPIPRAYFPRRNARRYEFRKCSIFSPVYIPSFRNISMTFLACCVTQQRSQYKKRVSFHRQTNDQDTHSVVHEAMAAPVEDVQRSMGALEGLFTRPKSSFVGRNPCNAMHAARPHPLIARVSPSL